MQPFLKSSCESVSLFDSLGLGVFLINIIVNALKWAEKHLLRTVKLIFNIYGHFSPQLWPRGAVAQ